MADNPLTERQIETLAAAQKAFMEVIQRRSSVDERLRLASVGATTLLTALLLQRPILVPVLADAINPRLSEIGWQLVPVAKH
jgi:hypothetical protein